MKLLYYTRNGSWTKASQTVLYRIQVLMDFLRYCTLSTTVKGIQIVRYNKIISFDTHEVYNKFNWNFSSLIRNTIDPCHQRMIWYSMQRIFDHSQPRENLFASLRPAKNLTQSRIIKNAYCMRHVSMLHIFLYDILLLCVSILLFLLLQQYANTKQSSNFNPVAFMRAKPNW